jgi:hypothetical protein
MAIMRRCPTGSSKQYVELSPTFPPRGDSIEERRRGILQAVDQTLPNDDSHHVGFLENECLAGKIAQLRDIDLLAA